MGKQIQPFPRIARTKHLDMHTCYPLQREIRSWLLDCFWVEMSKEKNKMDVLLEVFWRKLNYEKEDM